MIRESEINPGDVVELDFGGGELIRAEVVKIFDNDQIVPDVDYRRIGTEGDPAVKFEILTEEEGYWVRTGKFIAYNFSELERIMRFVSE